MLLDLPSMLECCTHAGSPLPRFHLSTLHCRCHLPAALGFVSGPESLPTFFQKLEFLCSAYCLLASTSSCFSWPGTEIVTRVSVLDLEHTFPLQKC